MIQPLFNGMLTLLLAKFVLNDLPHAAGLYEGSSKFTMYHATPKSNVGNILLNGLVPHPAFVGDEFSAIYIADSVEKAKDYAEQAYSMGVSKEKEWAIFRIEYDEFPEEIHPDLQWGLPGTYYTTMQIPPEHLTLVTTFDAGGNPTPGLPHAAGLLEGSAPEEVHFAPSTEFFHIANSEHVESIMRRGLNPPVYMILGRDKMSSLVEDREPFRGSTVLKVSLPPNWSVHPDEAWEEFYKEGAPVIYVYSNKRVRPNMISIEKVID